MTGSLQIKNGKFYVVIYDNLAPKGKKYKWISTGLVEKNNKRKAEEFLKEKLRELEDKKCIITKKTLFTDFITSWLEMMQNSVRPNTYTNYKIIINSHVIPYFVLNPVALQDIQPTHIQKYYNNKLNSGLSASTIKKHHANIHKALDYAVKLNLIAYNPADRVELPKIKQFVGKFYDNEQIQSLLKAVTGNNIEPAVVLTAYYGFRRSEVLGLKWSKINFKDKTVSINHTAVVSEGGVLYDDTTKNKSSCRVMPLIKDVEDYLLNLQKHQQEMKIKCGNSYIENDYICKWDNGLPLKPEYVTRGLKKVLQENNLPVIRFHDLRHSSASMLLKLGFNLKEIQEWLGHADITSTNRYAHLDIHSKQRLADKLEVALKMQYN